MEPLYQLFTIVFGTAIAFTYLGVRAYGIWAQRRASNLDSRRVEELEGRVAELEERADYADRLLIEGRHQGHISPPADTPV